MRFNSTEEAIEYGQMIREDKDAIRILKGVLKVKRGEVASVLAKGADVSDEVFQQGIDLATEAQLFREALESAEGRLRLPSFNTKQ